MTDDPWAIDVLDLEGYLDRLGTVAEPASRPALDRLLQAHVSTFTFDNVDVLLGQHAGVTLDAIAAKFVGRGRGGYCFEHASLFAAALERLGYDVERRLGRVGDPATKARTHLVVVVTLDGRRYLCDPGFGISTQQAIALADGAEHDHRGVVLQVREVADGPGRSWELHRRGQAGWELAHSHDELPVRPVDVEHGHHYTSTFPTSIFLQMLMVAGWAGDRHLTVTERSMTERRPGEPTDHREIDASEVFDLLGELRVPLTADERDRLGDVVTRLRAASG